RNDEASDSAPGLPRRPYSAFRIPHSALIVLAAGAATFLGFFLFEPYAVLDPATYLRDLGEQNVIISGRYDVPYTRQFVGTLPLVYQAKNLLGWGLGPLLGGLALVGLAVAVWRAFRRRRAVDILLLSWVLPYLALLASYEAKFMRYTLPIVPPLLIFGAALLADLGAFGRRRGARSAGGPADEASLPASRVGDAAIWRN